jgi:hypothetical protein
MSRPTSGKLRVLERMAQAAQEYLDRSPSLVARPPITEPAPLPPGLRTVVEQLAMLEDALSRSAANAAGIEKMLQTEAAALGGWVETLVKLKARLNVWAGDNLPQ